MGREAVVLSMSATGELTDVPAVCALPGCSNPLEQVSSGQARLYCCVAHRKIARRARRNRPERPPGARSARRPRQPDPSGVRERTGTASVRGRANRRPRSSVAGVLGLAAVVVLAVTWFNGETGRVVVLAVAAFLAAVSIGWIAARRRAHQVRGRATP